MTWTTAALVAYLALLGVLSLNGIHRLWMLSAFARRPAPFEPAPPAVWPTVTVQLPMFDERAVAARVIEAAGAMDYPLDKLEIQVLDDSTDATTSIAAEAVERLRARGVRASLLHRSDRTGFKAGAMDAALPAAAGELIAVFDADFVPQPDFLQRTVPHLAADAELGMVQARWGHLNADATWLTRAQATLLDGHFVIEHAARHATGRWFNFNGTAGVWRRQAIVDAGGWEHDTLTEDLDLSYRAQLARWRFRYLHWVVAPAELPADMAAFKTQQHRWAKGSIQTGRKLLGRIWRAEVPLPVRIEATAHLLANLSYPLVVGLVLLLPVAIQARALGADARLLWIDAALFVLALVPFIAFYGAAVWHAGAPDRGRRLLGLPVALAVGLGMGVAQTRAVLEGLFGGVGVFVRTPKVGDTASAVYRAASRGLPQVELALAAYVLAALTWELTQGRFASAPFLLLFFAGYAAVGASSLRA